MNIVDWVVIAVAAAAGLRGWYRGFTWQVFEFGGGLAGLVAGLALGPTIASAVTDRAGIQAALITLLVVFVALSIGQTVGFLVGHRFGRAIRAVKLGPVDSGLGSAFGIGATLIAFWLVGSILIQGPTRAVASAMQQSQVLKGVKGVMPKPPDVLGTVRHYLDAAGFPQVFVGFPRPIGPPVDLPPKGLSRQAFRRADQSTVRIVAPACGGTQFGSGWVAAPSVVVTNAHVVAGSTDVAVQDSAGDHAAEVVVFDADTDIAVLRVQGSLAGEPLNLEATDQNRGQGGAVLGFPGYADGRLVAGRAAVNSVFPATGRDIYGRGRVRREVYELRAKVRQGDSGGPFVLPNGNVAGVIFAASSTDPNVGYALTGEEVQDEIRVGIGRTRSVSTNGCTR